MTSEQTRILYLVKDNMNPLKSRLIEQLNRLEDAGIGRKARALSAIISRLEAWQNT